MQRFSNGTFFCIILDLSLGPKGASSLISAPPCPFPKAGFDNMSSLDCMAPMRDSRRLRQYSACPRLSDQRIKNSNLLRKQRR